MAPLYKTVISTKLLAGVALRAAVAGVRYDGDRDEIEITLVSGNPHLTAFLDEHLRDAAGGGTPVMPLHVQSMVHSELDPLRLIAGVALPPPAAPRDLTESECHEALMAILKAWRRDAAGYPDEEPADLSEASLLSLEGDIRDFIRVHWPLAADRKDG